MHDFRRRPRFFQDGRWLRPCFNGVDALVNISPWSSFSLGMGRAPTDRHLGCAHTYIHTYIRGCLTRTRRRNRNYLRWSSSVMFYTSSQALQPVIGRGVRTVCMHQRNPIRSSLKTRGWFKKCGCSDDTEVDALATIFGLKCHRQWRNLCGSARKPEKCLSVLVLDTPLPSYSDKAGAGALHCHCMDDTGSNIANPRITNLPPSSNEKVQLTQGLRATAPSFQDAVSRHLGYYPTGNSVIRSADPENPCVEPNTEWIGCTVFEIFAFVVSR